MTVEDKIAEVMAGGAHSAAATTGVKVAVLTLGFLALANVVVADYMTSFELRLSALYMLVMIGVAWFCGPWWGGLFAFLSAFAQVQVGLTTGLSPPPSSRKRVPGERLMVIDTDAPTHEHN